MKKTILALALSAAVISTALAVDEPRLVKKGIFYFCPDPDVPAQNAALTNWIYYKQALKNKPVTNVSNVFLFRANLRSNQPEPPRLDRGFGKLECGYEYEDDQNGKERIHIEYFSKDDELMEPAFKRFWEVDDEYGDTCEISFSPPRKTILDCAVKLFKP